MIIRHDPPREVRPYELSVRAYMKHVCWRKVAYPKKKAAEEAAAKAMALRPQRVLRVYQCPWCAHWHLTHKKQRTA